MKTCLYKCIPAIILALSFPSLGNLQDNSSFELSYEINKVYDELSISKEELNEAKTIKDLNQFYKPSWVKEFVSVDILTKHNGQVKETSHTNDVLSKAQIEHMKMADVASDITVKISYIPENNLSKNDIKELDFTFSVDPDKEATYPGGTQELDKYIETRAKNKIAVSNFEIYNVKAVKFTVDEEGHIVDAHVPVSTLPNISKVDKADKILLDAICNMPKWEPASYADGTRIKQDFVLTAGDQRSCSLNLLQVRRFDLEDQADK